MSPLYFPSDNQKELIRKEFDHLSPTLWENLFIRGNYAIFVQNTADGLEVYLISKEFVGDLKNDKLRRAVATGGLLLGKIVQSKLRLDLEGAWEVNAKGGAPIPRVVLSGNGEKKFLYHQEVGWQDVQKAPENIKQHLVVFVNNDRGENLGLAIITSVGITGDRLSAKGAALKPIIDRGFYLRGAG
jgi:ribosome biogenesis protein Nip4